MSRRQRDTVTIQHKRNQAGNPVVATGGVIGAEAGKGSRSLASSEADDVAGVDDEFLADGDGDVGSSKIG